MVTFISKTVANIKAESTTALRFKTLAFNINNLILLLKYILCIYYPLYFQKIKNNVEVLINFSNEVNAITPAYAKKLGF